MKWNCNYWVYIGYFSLWYNNVTDKGSLRKKKEEKVCFGSQFEEVQSIMMGKTGQQECEATGHIASIGRRKKNADVWLSFSLSLCHFCLLIRMHPHFCCFLWVLCDVFWSHSLSTLPNFILSDQQNWLCPSWFSLKTHQVQFIQPIYSSPGATPWKKTDSPPRS